MIQARKIALTTTIFVTLSFSTACAEGPSDELAAVMEDAMNQYAEVAGKVEACTHGGTHHIDDLAERIAAWRFPGWWDGLSGTRSDYAKKINGIANSHYLSTLVEPCPGVPAMYQTLADTMVQQIENHTRPDE